MRLFIFGNGFDRAHNFPTAYCQFRAWLIEKYNINVDGYDDIELPDFQTNYKGLESYKEEQFAEFFLHLIDDVNATPEEAEDCENEKCPFFKHCDDRYRDKWCSFEEDLAKLRWELILDDVEYEYDKEGDFDWWKTDTNLTIQAENCLDSNHTLRTFFSEWVSYINDIISDGSCNLSKPYFKDIFNNSDKYLTFNYTGTLEILYNIEDVCHIHGDISKWQDPVFGHCDPGYPQKKYEDYEFNAYDIFRRIYESYIKDAATQIKRYKEFFDSIKNVDEIYLFGLSFGEVDMPYFRYIFENCTKVKNVYLNVYNPDEFDEKAEKLKSYGAKCKINQWFCEK